jgi:hypothetical protein
MDAARGVLKLVERLCEEEPPSFQWQHLREAEELSDLQELLALRILKHTTNASSIWCTSCDSPHSVSVDFCGDAAYRAYCQEVGYFGVDPEDLRVLELNPAALTGLIGRGLGIPPLISAEEVVPRFLYRVGSPKFGPYRTRVYFARVPRPRGVLRPGTFCAGAAPRPRPGDPGFDYILAAGPSRTTRTACAPFIVGCCRAARSAAQVQ